MEDKAETLVDKTKKIISNYGSHFKSALPIKGSTSSISMLRELEILLRLLFVASLIPTLNCFCLSLLQYEDQIEREKKNVEDVTDVAAILRAISICHWSCNTFSIKHLIHVFNSFFFHKVNGHSSLQSYTSERKAEFGKKSECQLRKAKRDLKKKKKTSMQACKQNLRKKLKWSFFFFLFTSVLWQFSAKGNLGEEEGGTVMPCEAWATDLERSICLPQAFLTVLPIHFSVLLSTPNPLYKSLWRIKWRLSVHWSSLVSSCCLFFFNFPKVGLPAGGLEDGPSCVVHPWPRCDF